VEKPPTLSKRAIDAVVETKRLHAAGRWRWLHSVIVDSASVSNGSSRSPSTAGEITQEAGLLPVREFDERLGLTRSLRTIPDPRDGRYVTHELLTLLRQRVYQLLAGYEDANDATYARHDPTLQVVAHRLGTPLASQPTLSRLENAATWDTIRRVARIGRNWFAHHLRARRAPADELILDLDSTDDPTHGQQELSFFNGHYDEHMYHPLLLFVEGYLLAARLRPGDVGGATQAQPLLESTVAYLRQQRPHTPLALRADGGFCNPELLDAAESLGLTYTIGMPPNTKLDAAVEARREAARLAFERTGEPGRWFTSLRYQTRSWGRPRRVLVMVEHTADGPNVRYVVTNRRGRAEDIFHWYHQRGQAENWIKELKRDLAADRLSCHAFRANAFRLQLHALAHNLFHLFRARMLRGTPLAMATLGTVRLRLLKIGARVMRSVRRWWFHLASSWPGQPLVMLLHRRLAALRASP